MKDGELTDEQIASRVSEIASMRDLSPDERGSLLLELVKAAARVLNPVTYIVRGPNQHPNKPKGPKAADDGDGFG